MVPQLTKNNHFEFESVLVQSTKANDLRQFYVKLGSPELSSYSPFEQSVIDAKFLYDSAQSKNLILCLSGGIDSECLCRAFLAAKAPFEVCFLRFKDNLNYFDIKTNIAFCEDRSIKFSFIDIDIINFFESGKYIDVAKRYECQSPQIATHLWFLEQIDGFPVLSGNPIAPIWQNGKWFFVGLPGELHSSYFKFFLLNNREGVPWFFLYSPEMIKSFMHLKCFEPHRNRQVLQSSDHTYLEKCKAYLEGGFQVLPRENKFTGFELVKATYDQRNGTQHGTAFNELFRQPLEKLFPFPDEYFQLIPKEFFDTLL